GPRHGRRSRQTSDRARRRPRLAFVGYAWLLSRGRQHRSSAAALSWHALSAWRTGGGESSWRRSGPSRPSFPINSAQPRWLLYHVNLFAGLGTNAIGLIKRHG